MNVTQSEAFNWLKKSGYKVGVNIMQIPELSSQEIKNTVLQVKKSKSDKKYNRLRQ